MPAFFNGADCTWYGFWFGFGLTASIFLLLSAIVAWELERVPNELWPSLTLIKPNEGEGPAVDALALRRFEREAQVTASLRSPHTVQLYDFGITRTGSFYCVMELLEGTDLENLVRAQGPLEPRLVVHILEQTLDSLAESHSHGLVHRDIKPANLQALRARARKEFRGGSRLRPREGGRTRG